MKVGTDGVLVGAWGFIPASGNILDIGSGTGVIALMAAQRSTDTKIDAIEIEPSACNQCSENIASSPWADRINLIQGSIFDFKPQKRYNSILSNPPFFVKSLKNPNSERSMARHCSTEFSHKRLLAHVMNNLLTTDGRFSLILPTKQGEELIDYAQQNGIGISRLTKVCSFPNETPIRYLIEFCNDKEYSTEITGFTLYDAKNIRSADYSELMKDFYL